MSKAQPQYPPQQQQQVQMQYVPQQQYAPQQQQQATYTHTTVVVREEGCCSLRGRVKWVAGYNMVVGIFNLIGGIVNISRFSGTSVVWAGIDIAAFYTAVGGLAFVCAILLITGSIVLMVGLSKNQAIFFTVWIALIATYIAINIAVIGVNIYIVASFSSYLVLNYFIYADIALAIIFLLIQGLCIATIVRHRRTVS